MLVWISFLLISYVRGQNDQCVTRDGRYGYCQYFQNCNAAKNDYYNGVSVTFCSRNLICCPSSPPYTSSNSYSSRNQRISERKCEEYSKLTKEVSVVAPLSLGSTSANQQTFENFKCIQSTSLITGGQKTRLGEFPHMAAIGWRTLDDISFGCGGSLISNNFVLTAAHCNIRNGRSGYPSVVRLGDNDLKSKSNGEVDVGIQEFIMHENYDRNAKKNDIGLIKLERSVSFTNNIRPACIWTQSNLKSSIIATGYGKTSYYSPNSDELLKVQLQLIDRNNCDGAQIDSSQLCAGSQQGEEGDTCQGDSGGPLQIKSGTNKCIYYIVGITSYGSPYCGYAPSIYTRVSHYIDWIERKVWG